jgi:hypothetical protein
MDDPKAGGMHTMKIRHKTVGALLVAGLFAGGLIISTVPAGAESLGLLSTTTSVSESSVPGSGVDTLTATVSLELVKGALLMPTGTVVFSGSDNSGNYALGTGTLSRCVLGLPGLFGLWQETCTATDVPTAAQADLLDCTPLSIEATYSASADLLAKPSDGFTRSYPSC